jgi:hypothetical protein
MIQMIEHDTGSHTNSAAFQIEIGDLPIVTREIDHQTFADCPADQPGPRAARNDGDAGVRGGFDDRAGLAFRLGKGNGKRLDLIDRSVGGVKLPR